MVTVVPGLGCWGEMVAEPWSLCVTSGFGAGGVTVPPPPPPVLSFSAKNTKWLKELTSNTAYVPSDSVTNQKSSTRLRPPLSLMCQSSRVSFR